MIGSDLEIYTFEYLMAQALADVPDTVDKRQGSIIYDALAPACYRLASFYMTLRDIYRDTYVSSAVKEALDNRVADMQISRYAATYSIKKAEFRDASDNVMAVPLGSRFSTISDTSPLNYTVIEQYTNEGLPVPGAYTLQCETAGVIGNEYSGNLTAITFIQGLGSAVMSDIIIPARDVETDDELRTRYIDTITKKPFGGNIADYDSAIKAISGVGEVQIYPTWNGGGTVKCSIIDAEYNKATQDFVDIIQNLIDPDNGNGQGDGVGVAPIGHVVTITTASELVINIATTVVLVTGYTLAQLQDSIIQAIDDYLYSLRKTWGVGSSLNEYSLSVYLARVNAAILSVPGVANVSNTTLNGAAEDITLIEDATTQQLPILGTVTING